MEVVDNIRGLPGPVLEENAPSTHSPVFFSKTTAEKIKIPSLAEILKEHPWKICTSYPGLLTGQGPPPRQQGNVLTVSRPASIASPLSWSPEAVALFVPCLQRNDNSQYDIIIISICNR